MRKRAVVGAEAWRQADQEPMLEEQAQQPRALRGGETRFTRVNERPVG